MEEKRSSIHAAVRSLLGLGLKRKASATPQRITRSVKFKINTLEHPEIASVLNPHFDAFNAFRQEVLSELETFWKKDPESFIRMVKSSARAKWENKSSCYAWLYRRFLTGAVARPGLSRDAANAMLDNLAGNLKSFLTRRATVTEDIRSRYESNRREWQSELAEAARDKGVELPESPPVVDFDKLTEQSIERYNRWVGLVRMWCNLVLIQQHGLTREQACLPV